MERLAVPTSFLLIKYADAYFATDSAAITRLVNAEEEGREGDVVDLSAFFPALPHRGEETWFLHIDTGRRVVRLRTSAPIDLIEFPATDVFATAPGGHEGNAPWVRGVVRLSSLGENTPPFAMWIDVLDLVNSANTQEHPSA